MNRMLRAFVAACALLLVTVNVDAQNATDATYSIVIRSETVIDGLEVAGRQIAGTYGGTLLAVNAEGSSILVRLSDSRARIAAKDPRFVSVTVAAESARPKAIATDAEVVPWRTGVTYEYDGSGNVKKIASDTFFYDVASRLVQSTVNGETRKFEYDAFGNRTKCTRGMSTDCQGQTINAANNRITGTNVYDAAGNVIQLDGHQYTYDALNRMTSDTDLNNGVIREYVYTADDERVAVYTVDQWWRWTLRDTSGNVLREYMSEDADGSDGRNGPDGKGTANWQWAKDYIWRGLQLLATRQVPPGSNTPVTYHYHLDHLGTPRRITDGNDRIVGFHDYHAFGPEVGTGKTEPSLSLFKYTGHERDIAQSSVAPSLDYMHARYYSGALGRFMSVDPARSADLSSPQSWNLYTYALNNPWKFTDPDGEKWRLYTTIGFSAKTHPVEVDPRSISSYNEYLDHHLGERVTKGPVVTGVNAPAAFDSGLADPDGLSVFIGHGYTNMTGIHFTDAGKGNTLQNVVNKNSVVCLAGCGSAAFAKNLGITPETKGRAFVGFAGNVNAGFLVRISAQFAKYLNDGMTVGDAVNKLRKEYKKLNFRIVLIGDPNVKAPCPRGKIEGTTGPCD